MEKNKYLFYYEDAENAWLPCPEMVGSIVNADHFGDENDTIEIQFKIFHMTEKD